MPEEKGGKAPELTKCRNIIVIADESHRSQYDLINGLARNLRDSLPNASFISLTPSLPAYSGFAQRIALSMSIGAHLPLFTGTPIEKTDANTRAVSGDYISIYDIQRLTDAPSSGNTVIFPIYTTKLSKTVSSTRGFSVQNGQHEQDANGFSLRVDDVYRW